MRRAFGRRQVMRRAFGRRQVMRRVLRAALARNLPEYMIPAHFCQLDSLPLTPNGKVDRKALPPVEVDAPVSIQPAANETEHKLVAIWAEVLAIDPVRVGVTTSFLDLGGHS